MPKNNDDFFKIKKEWSKCKDSLLACYFKPYFSKIIQQGKPVVYIDCFAGKGKYDDGSNGSPLIACNIIKERLQKGNYKASKIKAYFIELKYSDDLKKNLHNYKNDIDCEVIGGKYEENIDSILLNSRESNIFMYIDPFGIKGLDPSNLNAFCSKYSLQSVEILINFNSFGFFREACRTLKLEPDTNIKKLTDGYIDSEKTIPNSKSSLDTIFGSDDWEEIVNKVYAKEINVSSAEMELSKAFCKNLYPGFKYVLNMPIRKDEEINLKYRMVYATNHSDGCLLMADNMYKRCELSRYDRKNGQSCLFELDINDNVIDEDTVKINLLNLITNNWIDLKELFCKYFMMYGIMRDSKGLIDILKRNENQLDIWRKPYKSKTGKRTSFWMPSKNQRLCIRKKNNGNNNKEIITLQNKS